MKKRVPQPTTAFTARCPAGLDGKTWKSIEPIFKASYQAQREIGRFRFYPYLAEIYRTYKGWKRLGTSKRNAGRVARCFGIARRKGTSPIRTLIDVTFPSLDPKQKSRWSRALELAALAKATPEQLPMLFKRHSGIAGCARLAAEQKPAKETYRDDWAVEHSVEREERIAQHRREQQDWASNLKPTSVITGGPNRINYELP
jgi:hypothetical protein